MHSKRDATAGFHQIEVDEQTATTRHVSLHMTGILSFSVKYAPDAQSNQSDA